MARKSGAPETDLPTHRPDKCPCCGAELVSDKNENKKHHIFEYACGAGGFYGEKYITDPICFDDALLSWTPIEWTASCPHAMKRFMDYQDSD
jgi:hypothetical protein